MSLITTLLGCCPKRASLASPRHSAGAVDQTPLMAARVKAGFVEPTLLLRTKTLPNDPARREYQLKFDGYRAIAFKTGGKVSLRSRNDNDFSLRYPAVTKGVQKLPNDTRLTSINPRSSRAQTLLCAVVEPRRPRSV